MFDHFRNKVKTQMDFMVNLGQLHKVNIPKGFLYDAYLALIPVEDRQQYTCSCCRSFFNKYGNLVVIKDQTIHTVWDFTTGEPFGNIAFALRGIVQRASIQEPFFSKVSDLGTNFNFSEKHGKTFNHLHFRLPANLVLPANPKIGQLISSSLRKKQVFSRGMKELTLESAETALTLINEGLYRGTEFTPVIRSFVEQKKEYLNTPDFTKELWLWENYSSGSLIRNSAIGTLLIDLSEGVTKEVAKRKFEASVVAVGSYHTPSRPASVSQITLLENKVKESGLLPSLERRFANQYDLTVNSVLYVDRKEVNKKDVFGELKLQAPVSVKTDYQGIPISISAFIEDIVPQATSLELLFTASLKSKLMSLTTCANKDAPALFHWGNNVSHTYVGNFTDSIKERVKQAGGNITGLLRVSLAWFNFDDLDLWLILPNGHKVFYGDRTYPKGKISLDVDANGGSATTRTPVENIILTDKDTCLEGTYQVIIDQFFSRETKNIGFQLQIEAGEFKKTFERKVAMRTKEHLHVAKFDFSIAKGLHNFSSSIGEIEEQPKALWNLELDKFHRVTFLLKSPNYWGEQGKGNLHHLFILENAINPNEVRGIFNEYLSPEFKEYSRAFESLGNALTVPNSKDQLSGLGFSSTLPENFLVRVDGKKIYNVKVGV